MITSFSSRHMRADIHRAGARPGRKTIALGALALLFAIAALAVTAGPQGTPAECGATGGDRCAFENAPPRIGPEAYRLPGRPQIYARLVTPLSFTDAEGAIWTAPRATLTDGASIPPVFVPLIGAPRSREFLAAAALHDAYCGAGNERMAQFRTRGWEETHRMFYQSLRAAGVEATKAKIMFAAVYLGGPRWNDPARSLDGVASADLRREMLICIRFIKAETPSLAELEAWMRRREATLLAAR